MVNSLRQRGEPLRLPGASDPVESKLYQRLHHVRSHPLFLQRLSEEAQRIVQDNITPTRLQELINTPPPEKVSEVLPSRATLVGRQLNEYLQARLGRGELLRLPRSDDKNQEERSLFNAIYRYRYDHDFLDALAQPARIALRLEPETDTIRRVRSWSLGTRETKVRAIAPTQGPAPAAQQFNQFVARLQRSSQIPRLPNTADPRERLLLLKIRWHQDNPDFFETLSPPARDLLTQMKTQGASRHRQLALRAAEDYINFVTSLQRQGKKPRLPMSSDRRENALYQRIRKYCYNEDFRRVLPAELKALIDD